jgi:ferric-dicitrate binding protein FerR (iron transport regulator)
MNGDERMHHDDDYLWDRSGPVDADIARLERLLRGYGHAGAPRRARGPLHGDVRPRRRWRIALAAAAVLACCAVAIGLWYRQRLQWDDGRPWQVVAQGGDVRIDGRSVASRAQLAIDDVLETGNAAAARLRAAGIGEIALGEGSRLRLVETRTGRHRVQLQQGRLWARVWAPPGQFGIGLHGMDVLDLGCEFLVDADAHGNGTLTVLSGWVQVDNLWREVLVPQDTRVRLRGARLAGTPYDIRARRSRPAPR